MKNLKYLEIEHFDWYSQIVETKTNNEFLVAPETKNNIKERYEEYCNNFDSTNLNLVRDSKYPQNHQDLIGCYTSKTKKVIELLSQIRKAQTLEAKSKCQYCGINKPNTIDHYLPKSLYPEFAVLAINLIPCCGDCNNRKDNYWKEGGSRGIINFYIDNIPNEQFLIGNIVEKNSLPTLSLEFNFSSIDQDLSRIIAAHYNRLKLFKRYEEESANEISEIKRQHSIYAKDKTAKEKSHLLKEDSKRLQADYGKNYWKAILRAALSDSDLFLNN